VASKAESSLRRGGVEVLKASGVVFATTFFLPGVFVRMACQLVAGAASGCRIVHRGFLSEVGGEPEYEAGSPNWSALLLATFLGPLTIGSLLLLPAAVRFGLLDVNPFLSVDPRSVVSHESSVLPFMEVIDRFGFVDFLRLWFGVSCFYCSVPSGGILDGAIAENRARPRLSVSRLALAPLLLLFRLLRGIDTVLLFGFPGVYLASGLIVLLIGWRSLVLIAGFAIDG
jgi:hypothetical protein